MMKTGFDIFKYSNPSGELVWRVSGTLNGKRIRKNFKARSDAVAYRQECSIEALNAES